MNITFREELINDELPGVLVMSHGLMAREALLSAEMIIGPQNNFCSICYCENDSINDFYNAIKDTLDKLPKETIVFLDLFGGTPYNQFQIYKLKEKKNYIGITGFNLPILLETLTSRENKTAEELANVSLEIASTAITRV